MFYVQYVKLERLWLQDFRSYKNLELELPPGLTAIVANNGIGKTNLVEACAYLATLRSFRSADNSTMIHIDAQSAVIRGEAESRGRQLLIEAQLVRRGRAKVQVNRQRLIRYADLGSVVQVSVFTPDDLAIIKGSPSLRRDFFDDAVISMWPRHYEIRKNLNQILRQRNAFLRQRAGRLDRDATVMLDIWDERFSAVSEVFGAARLSLLAELEPLVQDAYLQLSRGSKTENSTKDNRVEIKYEPDWFHNGIHQSLIESRQQDLRRATTLQGPHRDDFIIELNSVNSRTHASQGEQRTLALSLRLAVHQLLTKVHQQAPLLILDDVFSELDALRSESLFSALPPGQTIMTSAVELPDGIEPDLLLNAEFGKVYAA